MSTPPKDTYITSCKLIQQLYQVIAEWKEEGSPSEGGFDCDTIQSNPVPGIAEHGALIWSDILVYRRRHGGRNRRYRWVHEEAPVGLVSVTDSGTLYLSFRGTNINKEWDVNLRLHTVDFRVRGEDFGKTHYGFTDCFETMEKDILDEVLAIASRQATPIREMVITGHSLGGAYATLAFAVLANHPDLRQALGDIPMRGLVFGCPRVGSNAFAAKIDSLGTAFHRVENTFDAVPRLIPEELDYQHVGALLSFDQDLDSIVDNHSMDTYLAQADALLG